MKKISETARYKVGIIHKTILCFRYTFTRQQYNAETTLNASSEWVCKMIELAKEYVATPLRFLKCTEERKPHEITSLPAKY